MPANETSEDGQGLQSDPVQATDSVVTASGSSTSSNNQTIIPLRQRRKRVKLSRLEVACPVCSTQVIGSEDEVNEHINQCVAEKESREQVEEYEWAGYSKIRTTYEEATRMAGSGMLRMTRCSESEQLDIVDIEGDVNVSMFGPVQYNSDGCIINKSEVTELTNSSSQSTQPGSSSSSLQSKESTSPCPGSKCAVCLDPLIKPLVSVVCWHIHCESCWLQTLNVKKLCPRCTVITSFDDLRRVYL